MNETVAGSRELMAGEPVTRPILLKEAREAAGLHIAALAAALKVPVKKLEALEAGRYSELPDLTFARALASSACRQLKVDPVPVLQQIPIGSAPKLGDRGPSLNASFNAGRDEEAFNPLSWLSRPALLAAIALLLGALVIVFLPKAESPPVVSSVVEAPLAGPIPAVEPTPPREQLGDPVPNGDPAVLPVQPTLEPSSPANAAGAPATADAPTPTAPAVVAAAAPVSSSLLSIAATGESWVEVVNGTGNVVAQRLLQAGDVLDFSAAPPYTVVLGKADAARVSVRGLPFDVAPFSRSNVARFEVK